MLLGSERKLVMLSATGLSPSRVQHSLLLRLAARHLYSSPTTPFSRFRLLPFRSPLLRESLLLSFPLATKMFQFTRLSLACPWIQQQFERKSEPPVQSPAVCSGFQTQSWQLNTRVALVAGLNQHLTARADDSHAPPVSAFPKAPLSFRGFAHVKPWTTGVSNPIRSLAFVSQCQCRPSRVLSPLVFFPISTHFTAPPEIPSAPTVLQLGSFHRLSRVEPWDLTANLKAPTDALRPIIPDNACILCLTAAAGTELADAYSPDTVIASSPGKEVHDP
ncbi:hypothetical protein VNO80_34936 [Phaseolus coccineus]|uniref:Uncharacterized protein n=1 Tax=Phaseolus coccineus TaxID=3886 RepID=A0AAN9KUI7_PHACN